MPDGSEPPGEAAPATCAWCGRYEAAGPPPTWTAQVSERGRGRELVCDTCTRQNLRGIEGRLSSDWW